MSRLRLFFLGLLVLSTACQDPTLTVQTQFGPVTGYATTTHRIWKGIPFGAPPVGNLRWQAPQSPSPWTSALNTSTYGPSCINTGPTLDLAVGNMSEDCLYLNVFVPLSHTVSDPPLPVMLWIYGGSFIAGSGNMYDGQYLSGTDFIFVSINYRLGAFGFLALPALLSASTTNSTGFYGIQDQRLGMQWVQNNIAAFGGNASRVTIAGESAGAISICAHLAAPASRGLFSSAIMESGYCTLTTSTAGLATGEQIASDMGCGGLSSTDTLTCIYGKTAAEVTNAYANLSSLLPTIFPSELAGQPINIISAGGGVRVPLLIGTNLNEEALFVCPTSLRTMTQDQYEALIFQTYTTSAADEVIQAYPVPYLTDAVFPYIDYYSDLQFKCPTRDLSNYFARDGAPTYMYSFEHAPAYLPAIVYGIYLPSWVPCLGVAHSFELAFLFDYYPLLPAVYTYGNLTADEQNLSTAMRNAWASFVVSHTPSLPNQTWPLYNNATGNYVHLNMTISTGSNFRRSYCDLLDAIASDIPSPTTSGPANSSTSGTSTSTSHTSSTSSTTSARSTTSGGSVVVPSTVLVILVVVLAFLLR